MKFTKEEYDKANEADLVELLQSRGVELKKQGNSYCGVEHDSFVVKNNHWFWNSQGLHGGPIDYLTKIEGMTLPDAVHLLANGQRDAGLTSPSAYVPYTKKKKEKVPFVLPTANSNNRRVFEYLNKTRHIDSEIINWCIKQGLVYESNVLSPKTGKSMHNCVFTGLLDGKPVFATMRGLFDKEGQKPFRHEVDGSLEECRFVMPGRSNTIVIFEAPIDAMSHATLWKQSGIDWTHHTRVALCGNCDIALEGYLKRNPHIKKLVWSVDNDAGGQKAIDRYFQKYADKGYTQLVDLPKTKDWNSDLQNGIPYFFGESEEDLTDEEEFEL
jgi:DNA primase (bacterial type)